MLSVLTVLWLTGLFVAAGRSPAQNAAPSEYEVKAAFIVNFVKYVEWPATAFAETTTPLSIGILGDNPFGAHLEQAARDRPVDNRAIQVKTCRSLEEARQCHALFISDSEKRRLPEIIGSLGETNVLTIGETDGFTKRGGIINFFREGKKFRFEINIEAAKKAKLKISSKLLSLASTPGG